MLELAGITKRYPGAVALDGVSVSVAAGEVLGVLGENGAGKSTLMNVVAGLAAPDAGTIRLDGRELRLRSPHDAMAAGVGMVHQHFKLVEDLTVEENLALGRSKGLVDHAAVRTRLRELCEDLGIELDAHALVGDLSVGLQQRVEIVKALWSRPKVLILDEPTGVLAPEERSGVTALVRRLKAKGGAILFVSHKLDDIEACCDRVVVMRRGKVVDSGAVGGRSRADLVRLVIGGTLEPVSHREATPGPALLSVRNLRVGRAVYGASFDLHAGEIVALCGVEGNGQAELLLALAGMLSPSSGTIERRAKRMAHIPEDRLRHGVVRGMTLPENWLLTHLRGPWLRWPAIRESVGRAIGVHDVRAPSADARIEQLSGGNQQKFVLARELAREPDLIIAGQPCRGLDVRSIAFVQRTLLEARERGAAVLVSSSDLADVWSIADRIMVMVEGRLRGPVPVSGTSEEEIGHWMTLRGS
ncbi:MAG: ABC transporter ATP-binding protein [Betaproteobacteria bacterium]